MNLKITNEISGSVNLATGVITLEDIERHSGLVGNDLLAGHYRNVLDTKERMVREALIRLGWTPPSDLADMALLHSKRSDPAQLEGGDHPPKDDKAG